MFVRSLRMLLSPEAAEGVTTTETETVAVAETAKPAETVVATTKAADKPLADPSEGFRKALEKSQGDAQRLAERLYGENFQYREKLREIEAKVPASGSVVLTADEAKALDAYRSLGKPEDLRKVKAEHGELATQLTGLRRDDELRTFADRDGVKVKFAVLRTIAGNLDFTQTVKVKDKAGKESEVPAVKDGDADPVAFDAYAERHWKDFLPALRPEARAEAHGTPRVGANGARAIGPAVVTPARPVVRHNVF